ncbi:ANTAR domain-containing protein [Angustibacter speluncae]
MEGFVVDGVIDARQADGGRPGGPTDAVGSLDGLVATSVALLLQAVPGAAHTSVALRHDDGWTRYGDPLATTVDQVQTELAQGPAVDVLAGEAPLAVDDLAQADTRWPRFAARARELGVHATVYAPVCVKGRAVGRVGVLGATAGALTERSAEAVALVVAHLSAAASASAQVRQLELALVSRDVIGQAKGVLMERHGIDAERAFEVLVRYSRSGNTKLRDVAEHLVATRSLPDETTPVEGPEGTSG